MLQMYVLIKIKINKKQFMFINIKIVNGINKLTNSATVVVIILLKVAFKWIFKKVTSCFDILKNTKKTKTNWLNKNKFNHFF